MSAINTAALFVLLALLALSFALPARANQMDADNQCVAEKAGYPVDYELQCGVPKRDNYGRIIALGGQGCRCEDKDANVIGHCIRLFKCYGDTCNGKPCEKTTVPGGQTIPYLNQDQLNQNPLNNTSGNIGPSTGVGSFAAPDGSLFNPAAFGATPGDFLGAQPALNLSGTMDPYLEGLNDMGSPAQGQETIDQASDGKSFWSQFQSLFTSQPPTGSVPGEMGGVGGETPPGASTESTFGPPDSSQPEDPASTGESKEDSWWNSQKPIDYLQPQVIKDLVAVVTHYSPGGGGMESDFTTSKPNYFGWVNANGDPIPTTADDLRRGIAPQSVLTLASASENGGKLISMGPLTYTSPIDGQTYTGDRALADTGKAIYSENLADVYGYVHDDGDAFNAGTCAKYGTCDTRLSKYDVADGNFTGWSSKKAEDFAAKQPQSGLYAWQQVSSVPSQQSQQTAQSVQTASFTGFSPQALFSGSSNPWIGSIAPYLAQVDTLSTPFPYRVASR